MAFFKQFTFLRLQQIRSFTERSFEKVYVPRNPLKFKVYVTRLYRYKYKEILSKLEVPEEAWKELREDMLQIKHMREFSLDNFIMCICRTYDFAHAGIQYYKLLEKQGKPSIVLTASYLYLYEHYHGPLSDVDREHILEKYKEISENYDMVHTDLVNACIVALGKVGDTEECIKIIEQFKKHVPNEHLHKGYYSLITCFLEQKKIDLAHKYMTEHFRISRKLGSNVYKAYIKYCTKDKEHFHARIENLFKFWEDYGIQPTWRTMESFINACNKHGWSAEFTKLHDSVCNRCQMNALESGLTESEYMSLAKHIMKKLVFDKGYEITVPREWGNFTQFLDKHGPYDIVIDALNTIHSYVNKTNVYSIDGLLQILKYVKKHKKKTLVVGRLHLNKYNEQLKYYRTKADFYFVSNISQDDQFALYATVLSGKNAILISNDFMRQHKFLLGQLGTLFMKWQHLHQYTISTNNNELNITPLSGSNRDIQHNLNSCAQKTGVYWHISYITGDDKNQSCTNWACFRMPELQT
nr:mitochondrial ribonuclease P catalytic subunit [Megalopta genalis]